MKFFFSLPVAPPKYPAIDRKSMLNKAPLYFSATTKVDMPHGTQGTCVQLCTNLISLKLAQVNKAMVTIANCKWTTVTQFVYYRLKAWIVVSTPPRAGHLSLR